MMNRQHPIVQIPIRASAYFGIPLLDEGFDPEEEEVVEHSDILSAHVRHHTTDDSFT